MPLEKLNNTNNQNLLLLNQNKKRKRNQNTKNQIMVIINSREFEQDFDQHYFTFHASKTQLLRLKRFQLLLILSKISSLKFHNLNLNQNLNLEQDQGEEIENKSKDSLASLIIDARSNPHNFTFFPSQSQSQSQSQSNQINSFQFDMPESNHSHSQVFSSQPLNFTRTLTRVKSLPDHQIELTSSQTSRQNRTCTRSRSRNMIFPNNLDPSDNLQTGTRKTRSATQAEEMAGKTGPFVQSYSSTSKSSWRSSPSVEEPDELVLQDQSTAQTPRRLPNRRKTVKFIGQRSAGQTPIACRTRRSSHRTTPSTTRTSNCNNTRTGGRNKRRATFTSRNDTSSISLNHRVITPTLLATRKLRNGKVIRLKKQINLINDKTQDSSYSEQELSSHSTEEDQNTTASSDQEDNVENERSSVEIESVHSEPEDSDTSICDASQIDPTQATQSDDELIDRSDETNSTEYDSEQEEALADDEFIDLSQATFKRLLRLKRDNLVKLCTERELEAEGTKKDLVQNLLVWRDTNDMISPSSDPCQPSSESSNNSKEEQDEDEEEESMSSVMESFREPANGTCSRPILLDSEDEQDKNNQRRVNKTTNESSTVVMVEPGQRKDDVGELLDLESLNLQDKEIQCDQLKKLEKIGSGGFKDVYKGIYKKVTVAIAEIRGHLTEMDLKELRILRDLRHENIVRFIGVSVPGESHSTNSNNNSSSTSGNLNEVKSHPTNQIPIMIITELCTNGDLFDYIRNTKTPSLNKIIQIFKDICKGLSYLHNHHPKIIHRDLKSSNVLITSKGVAKLNDFGLARIKNSTRSLVKSLVGTVNWQAPELWVAHPRYNEKVDVYSAGLVLWEMLQWHQPVKRYPFEGQNEHAIYQDVGHRQLRPSTAGMRRHWGDEIINLVEKLWAQSPFDRPDMSTVLIELDSILKSI